MSKPASIRELLDWLDKPDDLDPQVVELAERVEKVLEVIDDPHQHDDALSLARAIYRALEGQP